MQYFSFFIAAVDEIRLGTEQNFFKASEIYFQGPEIYFQAFEIYFQATEITCWCGQKKLFPHCGGVSDARKQKMRHSVFCGGVALGIECYPDLLTYFLRIFRPLVTAMPGLSEESEESVLRPPRS